MLKGNNKMKEKNYNRAEDLINDDSFVEWVIDPNSNCEWNDWQLLDASNKLLASKAKEIISGFTVKEEIVETKDIDLYLKELKASLKASSIKNKEDINISLYNSNIKSYYGWAASIIILIVAGALLYSNYINDGNASAIYQEVMVEKVVPRGQKLTVTLDDGSTVILNSESKIRYGKDFINKREVFLEGEAFFEVTKNQDKPFNIQSGDVITTVLGTSFNIKAYPNEDVVQVVVASGNVKVNYLRKADSEKYLSTDEMVQIEKKSGEIIKEKVNLKEYLSWKNNVIFFKDADFIEISSVLEKWYNVKFVYNKTPDVEKFNGIFKGKSLKEVLDGISFSAGFNFRIEDKTVYIEN